MTSFTALSSAVDFLKARMKTLKEKRPKVSDMVQIFFSAFKAANKSILDTQVNRYLFIHVVSADIQI